MVSKRGWSQSKLFQTLLAIGVLFGIAVWNPLGVSFLGRGIVHTVLWPFETGFSFVSFEIREAGKFLSSIGDLKQENESLREENLRLHSENAELLFLRAENETVRAAAGIEIREKFQLLSSEVIAQGGEAALDSIVINKGALQGVSAGMPAIVGEGVLIGMVDEVYPASARIVLLSSSKSTVGGITVERGAKGVVRGERGLGITYDMLSQNAAIDSGDRVVTSGAAPALPSGLLIGTVGQVRNSEDRLFRNAGISSPVDFSALRFVFLIQGTKGL